MIRREILKEVLLDNRNEVVKHQVIPRSFQFEEFGNYVFVGIRRAGKSFLLYQRIQELLHSGHTWNEMLYVNFEDERLIGMTAADLNLILEVHAEMSTDRPMLFLDEIQNIDGWDKFVRRLADNKYRAYVTGSNAHFLSKDVITEFRGRGDEVHMYPLSFAEFMSVYPGTKENGWREYVVYGGLPLVLNFKTPEEKITFLKALFEETYISDIVGRHKIRNRAELEELLNILSSAIGSLTNPTKLSAAFKSMKQKSISAGTIKNYIDYLCDSFLIDSAIRYDIKGKKYIDTPVKYYFTDMGLRNARLNFRQLEETHTMENVIFNELKLRGFNVDVGVIEINSTNEKGNSVRKQLEIDFVCNKGSKRYYIQSAYAMPDQAKMEQEQRSLMLTGDAFKKIIITKDSPGPYYNEDGVLVMNIFDFLLDENMLNY